MDEIVIAASWRSDFLLAREATPSGADRYADLARRGELIRLVRGVYIRTVDWESASPRERHIHLARAVTLMRERRLVLSHRTAAVAWDLPLLGDPPDDVHVISTRAGGGRSDDRLVRHCLDIPLETVVLDGLEATTLARTVVDVARTSRFAEGVTVADAVLARGIGRDALAAELPEPGHRGARRAREVVSFARRAERVAARVAQSGVDRRGGASRAGTAARVPGRRGADGRRLLVAAIRCRR